MTAGDSSPALLRALWAQYEAAYRKDFPSSKGLSKREFCQRMEYKDESLLSKWMRLDAPNHKRIPLEHIPALATGMRLSERDQDRLMTVRLREMKAVDKGIATAVSWAVDAGRRSAMNALKGNLLSDDEALVLAAYRVAKDEWPLGIVETQETATSLVAHFQAQLERSATAQATTLLEAQPDDELSPEAEAKLEGYRKRLKLTGWRRAQKRGAALLPKTKA